MYDIKRNKNAVQITTKQLPTLNYYLTLINYIIILM